MMSPESSVPLWVRALFGFVLWSGAEAATTAEKVLKKAGSSVVRVRNVAAQGSGVVIDRNGLILCPFHVIYPPLDLQVDVTLERGGKERLHTFTEVEVVGVHSAFDIAMLRVSPPPGVKLERIGQPRNVRLRAGQDCFVLGAQFAPGASETAPLAEEGILSAEVRNLDGLPCIQIDARIQENAVGGPLVNKSGDMIGLVSFSIAGTDRINFAVPTELLATERFGPVSDRETFPDEATELSNLSVLLGDEALQARGQQAQVLVQMAIVTAQMALSLDPLREELLYGVGYTHWLVRDYAAARAYFDHTIEQWPDYLPPYVTKGMVEYRERNPEAARAVWETMLHRSPADVESRNCLADGALCLAMYHYEVKSDLPRTAFFAAWCAKGTSANARDPRVDQWLNRALPSLTPAQLAYLKRRRNFSLEELDRFLALEGSEQAGIEAAMAGDEDPASEILPRLPSDYARVGEVGRRLAGSAAPPPPEGLHKRVPYQVEEAHLAGGGTRLLLRYRDWPFVGILDVTTGRFIEHMGTPPGRSAMAAAGNTLVFSDYENGVIHVVDIETRQPRHQFNCPVPATTVSLAMTPLREDVALVGGLQGGDFFTPRTYGLLNLNTGAFTRLGNDRLPAATRSRQFPVLRAGPWLSAATVWDRRPDGQSCALLRAGAGLTNVLLLQASQGALVVGAEGDTLISTKGYITSLAGQTLFSTGNRLVPVLDADYFLDLGRLDRLWLRHGSNFLTMARLSSPMVERLGGLFPSPLPPDQAIFAVAHLDLLILVDATNRWVHIGRLGLREAGGASLDEERVARRGEPWQAPFPLREGEHLVEVLSPPGLTVDEEAKVLRWTPDASQEFGPVEVSIRLRDPEDTERLVEMLLEVK